MTTPNPKAVVIISGGLDSTVAAYQTKSDGYDITLISFNYGQRHKKELEYAAKTAEKLSALHHIVDLSNITKLISNSALTNPDIEVPHGHYAADNMKSTVVPNRNAIMIAIATGLAVNIGAEVVVTGVHSGDHHVYPDCRPQFIEAMNDAMFLGNEGFSNFREHSCVLAPFVHVPKDMIVQIGQRLSVPFEDTWSCYEGGDYHCGQCGTCVERKEAFELAGVKDPTLYKLEVK